MVTRRRIVVAGTSGSGKTTLARRISRQLDIPHIELDAIHHQPGWIPMPENEFRAAVAEQITGRAWVADGNYNGKLGDLLWRSADTVIWFDLPRTLVLRQTVLRTLGRVLTRRTLWNGNRESWRDLISLDPQRSIIVWSWKSHPTNRIRCEAAQDDPAYRHIEFVRIRSHRDADAFLADLRRSM
ncbi:hypothetical protein K7711_29970 [Nocardia sp. CA2R105]|uniref:hypothetical protein n=1 Tax=Nocardia coffeae TaxID=2873381 RepID=UPI001CA5F876|nr:hypothetical protein [Nocardia coffeae]MBY8860734.1 hypothetical protein [Nocardia coffeae]